MNQPHRFRPGETVMYRSFVDRLFIIKEVNGEELLLVGHHGVEAKGNFIQKWKPASICFYPSETILDYIRACNKPSDLDLALADLNEKLNAVRDNLLSGLVNKLAIGIDQVKRYNELIKQVFGEDE